MIAGLGITRGAATVIALTSWTGLAIQFTSIAESSTSLPAALWVMLRYFTILSNLLVAVAFTSLALAGYRIINLSLLGGITVAISLAGAVSPWLVRGSLEVSAGAPIADAILHYVIPVAVLIFWLVLVPKGRLTRRDPFLWIIYPLLYFDYAVLRGAAEGDFAYRFLNGSEVGWDRTCWTAVLIGVAFLNAGFALVWADQLLSGRRVRDLRS